MRKLVIALFMLGMFATPILAEEEVVEPSADVQKIVQLELSLLAQRFATIQAKTQWLDREQRLLQREAAQWEADRDELVIELGDLLQCGELGFNSKTLKCNTE